MPSVPEAMTDKINANLQPQRTLIITIADYDNREYTYNWVESLKRTNETRFIIFCMDEKMHQHLKHAGYEPQSILISNPWLHGLPKKTQQGSGAHWSDVSSFVIQRLLYFDITVLFAQVDTVWLAPRTREYLRTFLNIRLETHAIFQEAQVDKVYLNTGFFIMRPTEAMKRLLADAVYIQNHRVKEQESEQEALSVALQHMPMDIRYSKISSLDVMHFPNAHSYFTHRLPQSRGVQPYIVHTSYLDPDKKKEILKDHDLWYIDDAYCREIDNQVQQSLESPTIHTDPALANEEN
ncbi:nucleotide-diphospho-sugar transferase-domain-containing protein [Radiomyces spectabilis]|uniref:nucleotide-diphospho-sugar transferase-domain-containing protein n=1 Tax=Radiomyces spectabilis TaxID=64574 RepID=UPI00222076F1|nr:nucleotide-diphospho-sugar transferase-domain-containing protein [Radiomyces spectabilis]KAI8377416.1 nucleotide-diphospho-sugar transferase-domain-containing protein [Radiomyces spectabilis]